ncbi:MAG: hypothetical protein ABIF88_02415 [archaeon]
MDKTDCGFYIILTALGCLMFGAEMGHKIGFREGCQRENTETRTSKLKNIIFLDENNDGTPKPYIRQRDSFYSIDTESIPPRFEFYKTRTSYLSRKGDLNLDGWITQDEIEEQQ